MGLIHGDHLVEQVAATAFDPTPGNSVLHWDKNLLKQFPEQMFLLDRNQIT
jgi:hypothetical protein